ncbi:hypothetical protein Lepto7375DRAFT_0986 [Leptolyngbya sp. PCC 7375]|nr:hypothetical protein Lepto7375DRAFT_0906 [Leptolyngbya sp. PCC 7375]EKU97114.1 hypothetical protein Lepto7375DRAFT_0986 [Leptolyngbya sp. PCC 7375]
MAAEVQIKFPNGMSLRDKQIIWEETRGHIGNGTLTSPEQIRHHILETFKVEVECWFKDPPDVMICGSNAAEEKFVQQALREYFQQCPVVSKDDAQQRTRAFLAGYYAGRKFS